MLLYDHRNWGDSDGLPRHHTNHYEQTQDAHDVIHYVATRPEVNPERISIWGSSFSGGIALIVGAVDPCVKVVVTQVPFVSGKSARDTLPKSILTQIYNDRSETSALDPTYIRIFPDSLEEAQNPANGTILGTEECWRHLQVVKEMGHEKENKVTVQSLFHAIRSEPSAFISQISPKPLFMTVCLQDSVIDPRVQLEVFAKAGEPRSSSNWIAVTLMPIGMGLSGEYRRVGCFVAQVFVGPKLRGAGFPKDLESMNGIATNP